MIRKFCAPTVAVVMICLLAAPGASFAASPASSATDSVATAREDGSTILPGTTEFVRSVMEPSPLLLATNTVSINTPAFAPDGSSTFAQRYRGRGSRRNSGAAAAIFIGAAAAIAGAAVLVYANRPECGMAPQPGGCGYGTKVGGGALVAAGIVGIAVGAATWR